ncbi:MAG: hypothetical protein K6U03_06820, partial [Firmicutes bacterium]|nr:hypothetical protein [Bacillota bacterium]
VFLLRTGGDGGQVAWVTALPALAGVATLLWRQRGLRKADDPLRTAVRAALANRLGYLGYILLSLAPPGWWTATGVIVCTSLMAIPGHVFGVAHAEVLGEVIPAAARRPYFARRFTIAGLAGMVATAVIPAGRGRRVARGAPSLVKAIWACLAAALGAFAFNDSGIVAAGTLLVFPTTAWLYLLLAERDAS